MKRIHLFVLLLGVCAWGQAQDSLLVFKPSVKNKLVQLDVDFGANFDLVYRGNRNMLTALTEGEAVFPVISFRLQHFFSQKWGWYASLRVGVPKKYKRDCYKEWSRSLETDYYVRSLIEDRQEPEGNVCGDIGVVYRIENSRWAFYPRLGMGVGEVASQRVSAEIKKKGGNELYWISYDNGNRDSSESMDLFILSAGFSVNYKLTPHLFLLLNANYTQPLGEKACYEHITNLYSKEQTVRKISKSSTLCRNLNISVGFGFPIYSGRKKKDLHKTTQKERMRRIMEEKKKAFGLFPGNK